MTRYELTPFVELGPKSTAEPSKEAIEAVETAILGVEWGDVPRAAILAYHAHLASKGLKVTSGEAAEGSAVGNPQPQRGSTGEHRKADDNQQGYD